MAIELRQLRFAVAMADSKSFSRAAATINSKQITLNRKVQQLQDQLGVKLFGRPTPGAIITKMAVLLLSRHSASSSTSRT